MDAGFARCLDAPAAAALAGNIEELRAYADEAWAVCGGDDGPDGGPLVVR